jgi:hypothetical protein
MEPSQATATMLCGAAACERVDPWWDLTGDGVNGSYNIRT